jgi:serine beta-lactamase-like protein LACTB, mitochondrial
VEEWGDRVVRIVGAIGSRGRCARFFADAIPYWQPLQALDKCDRRTPLRAGLLDLDAPIQQYVPLFPNKSGKITARLLLGHLSGIRHYRPSEYLNSKRYASIAETLKAIQDDPLLQPPGTKYFYSSYGFNLLGAALEGAASQEFLLLIQKQICEPLHLGSTTTDDDSKIVPGRSRFYSLTGGEIGNSPYTDLSDRWPSGGFLSTTEDLLHFGAAHLGGAFLNSDTRRLMFTSQSTVDGKETGVGFGWRIGTIANRRVYHHGGDSIGGRAFLLLWPDKSIVVAFMSNLDRIKFAETEAMALADAFA